MKKESRFLVQKKIWWGKSKKGAPDQTQTMLALRANKGKRERGEREKRREREREEARERERRERASTNECGEFLDFQNKLYVSVSG